MKKIFAILVLIVIVLCLSACASKDYKEAQALLASENYEAALPIFEALDAYEDSSQMVKVCKYGIACDYMDEKAYDQAVEIFELLGDYEDSAEKIKSCNYQKAKALAEQGEFAQAAEAFDLLGEYEDSAEQAEYCRLQELEQLLQGTWVGATTGPLPLIFEFDNGNLILLLELEGSRGELNDGVYRIDMESHEIYVRYNQIKNLDGTTAKPNDEEQLMFTYTYDGTVLVLESDTFGSYVKE